MLTIIGKATSINVRKVLWTCTELALPFARRDWQDDDAPRNPNRMVPVLVDEGFVLWESHAICRYLCNRHGGAALLPATAQAQARARVEQWMDWQATELNTAWRYAFMALVRGSPAHRDPARIAAGIAGWNRHVGLLDEQLGRTGAYVAGDAFSLADIVLALSVNRWRMTPMERPAYSHVAAWYARLAERPGFREWCDNGVA